MKPNLKRAVDKKELSVLDGRIISEIITALENCNQKLLLSILSNYKIKPDAEIWEELQKFNIEFDKYSDDAVEENKDKKKFLIVEGVETYTLAVNFLSSIETKEDYNEHDEKIYQIIVNRDETGKLFNCNTVWTFFTEKQRDYQFARILKTLEKYKIAFI